MTLTEWPVSGKEGEWERRRHEERGERWREGEETEKETKQ